MRLLETIIRREAIGFCYHTISDRPLPHVQHLYHCKSVAQFKRDLEFLHRRYRIVGYEELAESRGRQTERPCVVITFDDGLSECYDFVRPVLLEHGMPAIFFVTTDFLDNRRLFYRQKVALCIESYSRLSPNAAMAVRKDVSDYFRTPLESSSQLMARLKSATLKEEPAIDATCTRLGVDVGGFLRDVRPYLTGKQVQTLASDGFTIGAHGTAHELMGTMSELEARNEILAACAAVAKLVQVPVVPFAFPFNGHGVSRDMLSSVRETHPQVGLFFDSRQLAPERDFVVNRLVVDDPGGAMTQGSNLPGRLRRAYGREIVRNLISPGVWRPQ
jgi:peptidoglycan/xylan/chitin deacetylase (PgdA/CDA1 family)